MINIEDIINELYHIGRVQRGFENPRRALLLGLSKLLKELSEHELVSITDHVCSECGSTVVQRVKLDLDDPLGVFVCLHCKTESDSIKEEDESEPF